MTASVEGLAAKWRADERNYADPAADAVIAAKHQCADELEAALASRRVEVTDERLAALFRPGLRVCKGDYVVQIAVGKRTFTERYSGEDDVPRACMAALTAALQPSGEEG